MIKQASIKQLRDQELSKEKSYLVVTMCFYPRGLKKDLISEYRSELAPDRILFKDFKNLQKTVGHQKAFEDSLYEKRFKLFGVAYEHLRRLSEQSQIQDVFLVCQCEIGERCHRELLLLIAKKEFGAIIDKIYNSYPTFTQRMRNSKNKVVKTASNPLGLIEFPNDGAL